MVVNLFPFVFLGMEMRDNDFETKTSKTLAKDKTKSQQI